MLRPLARDLWVAEHPQTYYGVRVGARMTLVRLEDGALWMHSAVPIDDAGQAEIDQIGPVQHIVVPNALHHLYATAALARWPAATLYAPPGLGERMDLPPHTPLLETPPAGWRRQIDQAQLGGAPKLGEVVFHHRATRTLIATDLFFNLHGVEHWWSRAVLKLDGALDQFALPSSVRRLIKDPGAARTSADRLLMWDFDRVIMAHGEILETGGRDAVARALTTF